MEEKLVELLGDPATCPHGNPIPGSKRTAQHLPTVALADSPAGKVTVARISEKLELSDDGLHLVAQARLVPGASATVVARERGGVRVKTATGEHVVPDAVGEQLFVSAR